ncbi:Neuropeptides capa receptor [Toxocara canis]|uniref:Neuropeptides capa receptor n=1 Tax=Toxocara canis TaxID=6265 RepID=A0A0B2UIQ0_TOXCA|nr:Neuropeptides capa receptor [Toxocara canis]
MCHAAEALIDEWIQKANAINIRQSDGIKIAFDGHSQLEDLQRFCDSEQVAEFAWVTLRVSHLLSCFNNVTVSLIENTSGAAQIGVCAKHVLTVVFAIVFVVGLFGNLLTMAVVYCTPSLHSHTNYFLSNLACSDFFLIVFGVPFDLISLWQKKPPDLPAYCEVMSTSISLFTYSSVLTIVVLTAERFMAICYPFTLRTLFNKRKVINVIYLSWIIAFIPSLYIGLQFKPVTPDFCGYNRDLGDGTGSCDFVASKVIPFQYLFEVNMLLTFLLPVSFIIFCYMRILNTLTELSNITAVHLPVTAKFSDTSQKDAALLHVHMKDAAHLRSQQAHKVVIKMLGER